MLRIYAYTLMMKNYETLSDNFFWGAYKLGRKSSLQLSVHNVCYVQRMYKSSHASLFPRENCENTSNQHIYNNSTNTTGDTHTHNSLYLAIAVYQAFILFSKHIYPLILSSRSILNRIRVMQKRESTLWKVFSDLYWLSKIAPIDLQLRSIINPVKVFLVIYAGLKPYQDLEGRLKSAQVV